MLCMHEAYPDHKSINFFIKEVSKLSSGANRSLITWKIVVSNMHGVMQGSAMVGSCSSMCTHVLVEVGGGAKVPRRRHGGAQQRGGARRAQQRAQRRRRLAHAARLRERLVEHLRHEGITTTLLERDYKYNFCLYSLIAAVHDAAAASTPRRHRACMLCVRPRRDAAASSTGAIDVRWLLHLVTLYLRRM